MRLFIAIRFSDEVKNVLLDAIGQLRRQAVSGNFTRPENLHLTLVFIGESTDLTSIRTAMDRTAVRPFDLTVSGAGHFGNLYWVGIEANPILKAYVQNLSDALRSAGFDIERRAFGPHITIARQVETTRQPHLNVPKTAMTAGRVSLMKSERIGGKLTYTEVYGRVL